MATIARPGSTVRRVVPGDEDAPESEKTVFVLRVPTRREFNAVIDRSDEDIKRMVDADPSLYERRLLGLVIEDVENLKFEDGETFNMHPKVDGALSDDDWDILYVYTDFITHEVKKLLGIGSRERKNY